MDSLDIGGAQCVHANFLNDEDWAQFVDYEPKMEVLAKKFDVAITIHQLNEEDYSFIIMNKPVNYQSFYSKAAFEVDMSVEISEDFASRAENFIKALNKAKAIKIFHNLVWSKPKVLYFVSS